MGRKAKYLPGSIVNNFELIERTRGGTNPRALFRNVLTGEVKEHLIADIAGKKINARPLKEFNRNPQEGDPVGDYGATFIRWDGGYAWLRWPDGQECLQAYGKVARNVIRGYRQPARKYEVGQELGPFGLILASKPYRGKANFRHPDGNHKIHRVVDVERGVVTGRPRGRPQGVKNDLASLANRYDVDTAARTGQTELAEARRRNLEQRNKWNQYQREYRAR